MDKITGVDKFGTFTIATSFGKKEKIYHHKKWTRPVTRKEYLRLIEMTRVWTRWDWNEFRRNCEMLKLAIPAYPANKPQEMLKLMTDDQMKIILDDFEKYRMILFEN